MPRELLTDASVLQELLKADLVPARLGWWLKRVWSSCFQGCDSNGGVERTCKPREGIACCDIIEALKDETYAWESQEQSRKGNDAVWVLNSCRHWEKALS